jgi:hypothetical protein
MLDPFGAPPASALIPHTLIILASYKKLLGRDLLPPSMLDVNAAANADPASLAQALFEAPFVLATADASPDPVLNYGNRRALELWEMDWKEFTSLPGRRTAEAPEREARDRFLEAVRKNGFVTDYSGIQITRSGRRFRIREAVVWNLIDTDGNYLGQAACFSDWEQLSTQSLS